MSVLVFHDGKLYSINDEWVKSDLLPEPCYVLRRYKFLHVDMDDWYYVTTIIGCVPINLSDVPSYCLKLVQMLDLVQPK